MDNGKLEGAGGVREETESQRGVPPRRESWIDRGEAKGAAEREQRDTPRAVCGKSTGEIRAQREEERHQPSLMRSHFAALE